MKKFLIVAACAVVGVLLFHFLKYLKCQYTVNT